MKFTLDKSGGAHYIAAYREGAVRIGNREFGHSLILSAEHLLRWPVAAVHDLTLEHLERALQGQPEIIVLGTGSEHVFPPLALQAAVSARGIGLEIMHTAAACRTYNVLLSEDRRVVAALIIQPAG